MSEHEVVARMVTEAARPAAATRAQLWVGSYPPAGIGTPSGRGEGIYRVTLDTATGELGEPVRVVEVPAPSFVTRHGDVLYAVAEDEVGAVRAFRVRGDRLEPLGTRPSGGVFPCHLRVDDGWLYVANYGDGVLGAVRLARDGAFAAGEPVRTLAHTGSGPDAERQTGPHAHFVALGPGGHLLVVDLGTDEIRRYVRTPDGPRPAGVAATFPPGTGPRHLAFRGWFRYGEIHAGPDAGDPPIVEAYVSGELDATVHRLAWDPATDIATVVQTLPTPEAPANRRSGRGAVAGPGQGSPARPSDAPDGDDGADLRARWAFDPAPAPSHLLVDDDEVVMAVSGTGVLARYRVGPDGSLAAPTAHALTGPTPRHFAVVDGWTVVAEQVPGAVTVLSPEGEVVSSRAVPSASCIAR